MRERLTSVMLYKVDSHIGRDKLWDFTIFLFSHFLNQFLFCILCVFNIPDLGSNWKIKGLKMELYENKRLTELKEVAFKETTIKTIN